MSVPLPEGGPFASIFHKNDSYESLHPPKGLVDDPSYFVAPQVGDVVHFWPSEQEGFSPNGHQPLAAIVLFVHPADSKRCNLITWDANGQWRPVSSVMHRSFFTGLGADFEGNAYPGMSHWEYRK